LLHKSLIRDFLRYDNKFDETIIGRILSVDMGTPWIDFLDTLIDSICALAMKFKSVENLEIWCFWENNGPGNNNLKDILTLTRTVLGELEGAGHTSAAGSTWRMPVIEHLLVHPGSSAKEELLSRISQGTFSGV